MLQKIMINIIDGEIKEPVGGAHTDYDAAALNLKQTVLSCLDELDKMSSEELRSQRYEKFRNMGAFLTC